MEMKIPNFKGFEVDDNPDRFQLDAATKLIRGTYWGKKLDNDIIKKTFSNAHTFGLFHKNGNMVGCGRVVSDKARFAWLSDVIIQEKHRDNGLGTFLIKTILEHDDYGSVRRWLLSTQCYKELYNKFKFEELTEEDGLMEWNRLNFEGKEHHPGSSQLDHLRGHQPTI